MSRRLLFCLVLFGSLIAAPAGAADDAEFNAAVSALNAKTFRDKAVAIDTLARLDHPRVAAVLRALRDGGLYFQKTPPRMALGQKRGKLIALHDPLSDKPLGEVKKRRAKRVSINNALRARLRDALARLELVDADADADARLAAATHLAAAADDDDDALALLRSAAARERNPRVLKALQDGIVLSGLSAADPQRRLDAVAALAGSAGAGAGGRLQTLIDSDPDETVRAAAAAALRSVDTLRSRYALIEKIFFGLSLGSVLFLAAVGLAITFGVMGVINMAHGELIMIGAYTTYLVQLTLPGALDYSLLLAVPLAFIVAGLFGVAIERGVIRFLYGRPLETLLATFGISLILQQLARTTISAQNVAVANPSWMSGSWQINDALSLTYNRLYIVVFSLFVFAALLLLLKRSALGLQVRAVAQNRDMAKALGVRTGRVDALTFGLGAGVAGVAGVALSQLTNVGPNLGQSYIVDSFLVVVFGGVGNILGTLFGAFGLGVLNKFLEPVYGAVLAKILVLVAIILFIQKRPRGLFPQRGRAAGA